MDIRPITASYEMWSAVMDFAGKCSWRAGKALAHSMESNIFSDWERVIAAMDNGRPCGFCTVTKTDCIPDAGYTPYIGFIFVDEEYRGNRLSAQMIECAESYLESVGFDRVYLVSDHVGLYEKYGFEVIDRKMAPWGSEEKIYMRKINSRI